MGTTPAVTRNPRSRRGPARLLLAASLALAAVACGEDVSGSQPLYAGDGGTDKAGAPRRCVEVAEGQQATLSCVEGTIEEIEFASYGLPSGSCWQGHAETTCHAPRSRSVVRASCVGERACVVGADNRTFGDPCPGRPKDLAVRYRCSERNEPTNPCRPNPCQNGGLCLGIGSSFRCACASGFEGTRCGDVDLQPFVGRYERTPVQNNWHRVQVTLDEQGLWWTNDAGRRWSLRHEAGALRTGADCPYGPQVVSVTRTAVGDEVSSLGFLGGTYFKEPAQDPCRPNPCQNGGSCQPNGPGFRCDCPSGFEGGRCESEIPEDLSEVLVGSYEHSPVQNDWHRVRITRHAQGLRWTNEAGVSWSLTQRGDAVFTGPDCPYGEREVTVQRDGGGAVQSVMFLGGTYFRVVGGGTERDRRCDEIGIVCGRFANDADPIDCGECSWPATQLAQQARAQLEQYPELRASLADPQSSYFRALQTYVDAEQACRTGDWRRCLQIVERFDTPSNRVPVPRGAPPRAANLGSPAFYYALRVLEDAARTMVTSGAHGPEEDLAFTVALFERAAPGHAMDARFKQGATLDPRIGDQGYLAVREALSGFDFLVRHWSQGRFGVNLRIVRVDQTIVVNNLGTPPGGYEVPVLGTIHDVPREVIADTNLALLVFPSMIVDYSGADIIVGGNGGRTTFCSDQWLLQKKAHLGHGSYTAIERRVYILQWLQHEFMHYVFGAYPSFGLERQLHQWFDRSTWPSDFEGSLEPDYYHEAIDKRIHPRGVPPLHEVLKRPL